MPIRLLVLWVWLAIVGGSTMAQSRAEPIPLLRTGFSLRLPPPDLVTFHGIVSYDSAGAPPSQFLYPAPSIAGLLVAIATHGAIVESSKTAEKEKLRQSADKVLEPYRAVLQTFSNTELITRGIEGLRTIGEMKILDAGDEGNIGWVMSSSPVFWLSQDESTLVLENTIQIASPSAIPTSLPPYETIVKVVSRSRSDTHVSQAWMAENGKQLKQESVDLFTHSIMLVVADATRLPERSDGAQKTFRYNEGKTLKIERAHLVHELCDRAIVRTLRGWLLSIPQRGAIGENESQCDALGRTSR